MKILERLRAPLYAAALLGLLAPGCTNEVVVDEAIQGSTACESDEPASFCDDCNPCTADANCTPCSALPRAERDIHHCTPDDEMPAFCAGHTGCVHMPLADAAEESNGCFPVAGGADLHSGTCRAGVCVDDAP